MRMYYLCRTEDISGTSGTGHIAQVAEFDDGTVAVRWIAGMNAAGVESTTIFNSLSDLLKVHGHEGRTCVEPVLDGERVRELESDLQRLRECLTSAVAVLKENGIRLPEELASLPDSVCVSPAAGGVQEREATDETVLR